MSIIFLKNKNMPIKKYIFKNSKEMIRIERLDYCLYVPFIAR